VKPRLDRQTSSVLAIPRRSKNFNAALDESQQQLEDVQKETAAARASNESLTVELEEARTQLDVTRDDVRRRCATSSCGDGSPRVCAPK
jgi:peptidoglycan hydrolase CwlO-like protein